MSALTRVLVGMTALSVVILVGSAVAVVELLRCNGDDLGGEW
ncbi:hypothetical protein [Williamsia sp.]